MIDSMPHRPMLTHMLHALRPTPRVVRLVASGRLLMFGLAGLTYFAVTSANAFAETKRFQWSTRITVSERYDDNIDLESDNEENDWITTIGPGLTLAVLFEETEIALNYDLDYAYYAKNDENNSVRHNLTLTGLKDIPVAEHWTLDLEESFQVSEDSLERSEQTTSVQRSRDRYYRNKAGTRLTYLFGESDSLNFGFGHQLLFSDDSDVEDSQRFGPRAGITYWFNIRNGMNFDYEYARALFEESHDFDRHIGSVTYTYRFSPRTQTDVYYQYDVTDFDQKEEDYDVHSGGLGLSQQLTEHTSWSISGGFYLRDTEGGDKDEEGFNGSASLSQQLEKGYFTFSASGGYREQYIEFENLGFSQFYRASLGVNYQLLEKLSINISGFYQRDEYKDTIPQRDDDTWQGRVELSYLLLPWLSSSLTYQYRQRESTEETEEYVNNRVMLRLVVFYKSEPHPF